MSLASARPSRAWHWKTATPEEAGFVADLSDRLDAGVRSGLLHGLHAVVVTRSGRVVIERYHVGDDENWGRPIGKVAFGPDTLHDLRSVTKSVVGILYGIALDRGLVRPPPAPVLSGLPEYADIAADAQKAQLTVEHALTMTLGIEWDEQIPYTDSANSKIAMENAPDRLRFILERKPVRQPGTAWTYCGGATALLGGLTAKGAGKPLAEFAREALFEPLGIRTFEWATGRDGVHSAASGLRLTAGDLARIGALVVAGGTWAGRRIVSPEWIDASCRPAIPTGDGLEYGHLWFLGTAPVPALPGGPQRWVGGFGNGGQRLWIMPAAETVVAIFSGRYNTPDSRVTPTRIWREIALANLERA